MNDQIKSVSGIHGNLHLPRVWEKFWTGPGPDRYVDPWPVLEKQSLIIAKQKKLIFRLHEELEKRNLKTEEVLLVLQGVTMGLKGTRNGSSFSKVQQTESPGRPGIASTSSEYRPITKLQFENRIKVKYHLLLKWTKSKIQKIQAGIRERS